MTGFLKYFVKLFILYIALTNTMPPVALASMLYNNNAPQQVVNEETSPSQDTPETPVVPQNSAPVAALPVTSHKFEASAAILGLSTTDDSLTSANKRLGVRVKKLQKHDFKADEAITLTLDNPDQEAYKTKITDATGKEASVAVQQNVVEGTTQLQVIPTNQFKPGKYTISVTDQTGKTTQQDFTWGVLALNPDKAIYAANETAAFSMAVLDDKGSMVCNANVSLMIKEEGSKIDETLSTENKKIIINPECSSHNFTLKPDYEAHYQLGGVGTYDLTLTAKTPNGTRTISEQITVKQTTPFVIQRTSATRIYPPNSYPMQINVTANQDFNGTITETVPDSFAITPASSSASSYDAMKTVYLEDNKDPSQRLANNLAVSASGLVMPFDGNFQITQGFGSQLTDPILQAFYTKFGLAGHDGIDFGLPLGTPLYAVDEGKIAWAGPGDYGTQVIIKHTWGQTYYGHMSKTSVTVGDDVKKGSLLGYSGMSGEATGPHLHFGMKPTTPDMTNGYSGKIDPLPYLPIGNTAQGINVPKLVGLPDVLGASTSADASITTIPSPTSVIANPTEEAISSTSATGGTSPVTPRTDDQSSASAAAIPQFIIVDAASQESAQNQPQSLEKVKVIKWQVQMKKGDTINLSYNFKTPLISPQFYLIGSLKFFRDSLSSRGGGTTTPGSLPTKTDSRLNQNDAGQSVQVFDEGRQWQIAADDMGTGWYHSSASPYVGYEWPYRKKLTIDHTKVGVILPTFNISNTTAQTTAGNNNTTVNLVVGNNNNRMLLVAVNDNASFNVTRGTTVNTITANTSTSGLLSFTKINGIKFDSVNGVSFEFWYLVNPGTGLNSVKVTLNSNSQAIMMGVSSYYNVNQASPLGTQNTTNNTSTSPSSTVTSNTSQLVVDAVTNKNGGTFTVGTGQTQRFQKVPGGSVGTIASSEKPGGSSTTTMNWTQTSDLWADIAVPINGITPPSSETNFPVLVSLIDTNLKAHAQNTGNDILFTTSTGQTKIPSEVENYVNTTGELEAWVQVPSLSTTSDTNIYMYYGNGSVGSQSTPTTVWDSNYKDVLHSGEAGTTLNDSTSNAFNGTATRSNSVIGKIANGHTYAVASSDFVNINSAASSIGSGNFTLSAWVKSIDAFPNAAIDQEVFGLKDATSTNSVEIFFGHTSGVLRFDMNNGSTTVTAPSAESTWTSNTWNFVTATFSTTTGMQLYVNGVPDGINVNNTRGATASTKLAIGSGDNAFFFNGTIDEPRVSNIVRSSDWVATEYANESNPGTFFLTPSSEETKIYAASLSALMRHGKFFDPSSNNYGKQPFLF